MTKFIRQILLVRLKFHQNTLSLEQLSLQIAWLLCWLLFALTNWCIALLLFAGHRPLCSCGSLHMWIIIHLRMYSTTWTYTLGLFEGSVQEKSSYKYNYRVFGSLGCSRQQRLAVAKWTSAPPLLAGLVCMSIIIACCVSVYSGLCTTLPTIPTNHLNPQCIY